jgi:Tol biopolymer transport system component/predicted Ser/Thr protein kinase
VSLAPGSKLGPYEILAPLGAGGMGEVYRAKDTRIDRMVALKVLPQEFFENEERRGRFEREARMLASLNHPGIAILYSFEEIPGSSPSSSRHLLVMELLEGETLRERLAAGALPLRKALDLGAQIARALAAAHESGIVHRDLKPENIVLTEDGRAKILDFGLARQISLPASGDTKSPTMARGTEAGTLLGTVGYMAPEQVRGQPADSRSDIFAFGCVLFEMLTAARAFSRDTAAETMTAILREEPPEISRAGWAASGVSPAVERIVRHCLEKSPVDRFQSARDLAFDLESVLGSAATPGAAVAAGAPSGANRRRAVGAAVMLVLSAAGFVVGRLWRRDAGDTGEAVRPVSFQQLTDAPGVESSPTLSPDGKSVVYVGRSGDRFGLYLLRVGGRNAVPLTADSSADDWQPAFSPDGEKIAFRSERDGGGIFVMGSTGESVKRVTDFGFNPTWSQDGREIAVANGAFLFPTDRGGAVRGLSAVNVETGKMRDVTSAGDAMQPSWSPHGYRIAYWGLRGTSGQRDLWTVAADGSEAKSPGVAVTNDAALDWSPVWSPDGRFLYFSSNRGGTMNLWRVQIDERSGRVLGGPEAMTTPSLWSGEMSFSRDGKRLAYASLDWRSTLFKVAFDPAKGTIVEPPVPMLKGTVPIRDHQISPDGQWVAFMQTGRQEDLFVARTNGAELRRLTDDSFRDRGPSWSPDGQWIAFYSDRGGSYQLWAVHPDGSGLHQLTDIKSGFVNFPAWSPEGREIAVSIVPIEWRLLDVSKIVFPCPSRVMPAIGKPDWFWPFTWARSGGRIAGVVARPDGTAGAVAIYTLTTRRYEFLDAGTGSYKTLVWLNDGRHLLVRDRRGILLVDSVTKKVRPLLSVGGYWIGYSVGTSPDDRWITYTETATEGDIWLAELK